MTEQQKQAIADVIAAKEARIRAIVSGAPVVTGGWKEGWNYPKGVKLSDGSVSMMYEFRDLGIRWLTWEQLGEIEWLRFDRDNARQALNAK